MISLVVSSYKEDYFNRFSESVAETIGVPFEVIRVPNPGSMGICQAYNRGAEQAQYPYLCFVHEDTTFRTSNWGRDLLKIFEEDKTIVLAGLAGSIYKPEFATGWGTGNLKMDRAKITHVNARGEFDQWISNPLDEKYSEVRTLDGVFLFTRKTVWEQQHFNEEIKGFHFYDLEFSLRANRLGKIVVVYCVDLAHYSRGNFDDVWLDAAFDFHSKYKPLITEFIPKSRVTWLERAKIKRHWHSFLLEGKLNRRNRLKVKLYYGQQFNLVLTADDFIHASLFRASAIKRRIFSG